MRQAKVFLHGHLAGEIREEATDRYVFRYEDGYFADAQLPAISITMPKTRQEYVSAHLFPFFFNMLSEGHNREAQSRMLHIDKDDDFGILLATAQHDTPGAVTVIPF